MARHDRRRSTDDGGGAARWWWLALPALGLVAYAAFSATLGVIGGGSHVAEEPGLDLPAGASAPAAPPAAAPPAVVAPAAVDAPAANDEVAAAQASAAPEPSATPGTQRAAAGDAKKVKKKPAPQEHLTDDDRRALERVLENAGKTAR